MPWEVDASGNPVWVPVPKVAPNKANLPMVQVGGPKAIVSGAAPSLATPDRVSKDTAVLSEYRDYLKATAPDLTDNDINSILSGLYDDQRNRRQYDAGVEKPVNLTVGDIAWDPKTRRVPTPIHAPIVMPPYMVKGTPANKTTSDKPKKDMNPGV